MLKKSYYNLSESFGEELLLYNLVSNCVALLDKPYIDVYNAAENYDLRDARAKELYDRGFLVEQEKNEVAFINSRRHSVLYGRFHEKLFTILPTTDCNARCYYCYQEDWKPIVMDETTAEAVIEFIKRNTEAEDNVTVSWFGGEPLYNINIIRMINAELVQSYGDRYKSIMTSNGSFISRKLAHEMKKDWNMKCIQITIDGLKERYEKVKGYIDGKTFEDVIDAIGYCLEEGIRIKVRINIDKNNVNEMGEVCAFLSGKFGNNPLFAMYHACLTAEKQTCFSHGFFSEKEYGKVLNKFLDIKYKHMTKKTIDAFTYPLTYTTCSAKTNYCFVIDPRGKLFKCQHIHEEDCVGNVWDGPIFNDAMAYFLNPNVDPLCEKCIFFPACHGGCPNVQRHGLEVGGMCREIKYDYKKRLGIFYNIFKNEIK